MPEEPDNTSTSGGSGTPSGGGEEKTFTQAEVDKLIDQRIARERTKYSDYDDLKAKAQRLKEAEDADKSEIDKLKDRLSESESRASKAESEALRTTVASQKGLTANQAKRLSGSTKEELESDADELLESFGTKKSEGDDGEGDDGGKGESSRRRPKENLRPGASSEEEPEDYTKIADEVYKRAHGAI